MKKILLVPAPSVSAAGKLQRYLPLGLLSLRALSGHEHPEVDLWLPGEELTRERHRSSASLVRAILDALPALDDYGAVGLSTMCSSFHHTILMAREIRARAPELPIWLGGPHVSVIHKGVLEAFTDVVDAVFVGEAESSFVEVLGRVSKGETSLKGVAGVALSGEDVRPGGQVEDLDSLPFIELGETALEILGETERTIPLEVARGCPGKCTFCSTRRFWGQKVRRKSIGRIISEMGRYHAETGTHRFEIMGDNLSASLPWLRRFCGAMHRDAPRMRWQADLKLDRLKTDDLDLLWRGGCRGFFIGVESGCQSTLDRIRKHVDLEREVQLIDQALERGFDIKASMIVGFPWETTEEVDRTFRLHCELLKKGVTQSQIWLLCPLPGTDLLDEFAPSFGRLGSRISMDGVALDPDAREMVRSHPKLFAQLGRYETPNADSIDIDATVETAMQMNLLYSAS